MDPALRPAIEFRGVEKAYPTGFLHRSRRHVLGPFDLAVPAGTIFGYLGANGSGKTTTIKVLMGFVAPDAGSVTVFGEPSSGMEWRRRTGYLPEHPCFYDYLTAREFLDFSGRILGLPAATRRERAGHLLERVALSRSCDQPLRRFSKGMLQRLGIAQALIGDPELLVLDEPMSGLDPLGRRMVRDLILEQRAAGRTVFFSTHILPDAEALCDRVALLKAGRLVGEGRLDEILSLDVSHMEILVSAHVDVLQQLPPESHATRMGERWRLEVPEAHMVASIDAIVRGGGRVLQVQPVRQSLEEVFVREAGPTRGGAWVPEE